MYMYVCLYTYASMTICLSHILPLFLIKTHTHTYTFTYIGAECEGLHPTIAGVHFGRPPVLWDMSGHADAV